jgi:hypothetical protein
VTCHRFGFTLLVFNKVALFHGIHTVPSQDKSRARSYRAVWIRVGTKRTAQRRKSVKPIDFAREQSQPFARETTLVPHEVILFYLQLAVLCVHTAYIIRATAENNCIYLRADKFLARYFRDFHSFLCHEAAVILFNNCYSLPCACRHCFTSEENGN